MYVFRSCRCSRFLFFFFKHKTAYELRISDWSSDVCSSDLDRLELLAGYLIAYLNLDEVIRIIREEDEPKAELIRAFELSDRQAEAILNMRLRSLRKLEEMEIRREEKELKAERKELKALIASPELQRARLRDDQIRREPGRERV